MKTRYVNHLPPLQDIQVFVVAVRLGSFKATADHLEVSPAYVSKRIGLLEDKLNAKLFVRSSRHINLTLEGKIAFKWAEQLLMTMERMSVEISKGRLVPKGEVRIATSTGFGSRLLAPMISEIILDYPDIRVDLELLDRPVNLVTEGFDLEIRLGGDLPEHLIARKLASNYRIMCASPSFLEQCGTPQTLKELMEVNCIGIRERDQGFGLWRFDNNKTSESVSPNVTLKTNNGETARKWCLEGHGILLRSIWSVADDLRRGDLIHILPEYKQHADIHAVYPTRLETSAKLRVCVNFFKERLSAVLDAG